jgi:ACS family tartrate transporter-like MFS transporter
MATATLAASPPTIEATTLRKVTMRLAPLMVILIMVNKLDRSNIGFAGLTMNKDLGLSAYAFGLGTGIFSLGYILFEIPSNLFLHRIGANVWLARIMFCWGLVAMGMAFVNGPASLYVARFLLGVAEAGFIPGLTLYVLFWVPLKHRARFTAFWLFGVPLSGILGAPLSGVLLQLEGVLGFHGWQWLFIVEGLPAIVLAFVVHGALTPTPDRATWLSGDERTWLHAELAKERQTIEVDSRHSLLSALANWRVLVLGVLYIGMNMAMFGVSIWMPTIVKSLGTLSVLQVSLIIACIWACGGVSAVLWGRRSDRTNERYVSLAIPLLAGATGFLISAYASASPLLSIVCLTVATMGILTAYTIFWVVPGTFLTGVAAAGGIALINSMGNVGGFLGPFAVGWLKQSTGSFQGALIVLACGMAISGGIALAIRPQRARSYSAPPQSALGR